MSKAQNRLQAQALQEAIQALRGRQFTRAEQIAASILRTAKTDRAALLVHAHALLGQQRASEAVAPLEKAILRGSDPELETLLGAALCESRRGADGIAQLRKTAARRPPFLPAFQELAGRLAKSAELTEAIKVIEERLAGTYGDVGLSTLAERIRGGYVPPVLVTVNSPAVEPSTAVTVASIVTVATSIRSGPSGSVPFINSSRLV